MATILVVEDENAELFARALRIIGGGRHTVETCERADEAVSCARDVRPDCIVMDLRLPGFADTLMGGVEAIRQIRRFSQVPIFAVTAYGDARSRAAALDAGANLYQAKPVDFVILLNQIEKVLNE